LIHTPLQTRQHILYTKPYGLSTDFLKIFSSKQNGPIFTGPYTAFLLQLVCF